MGGIQGKAGNKGQEIKQQAQQGALKAELDGVANQLRDSSLTNLMGILHGLRMKALAEALKSGTVEDVLTLIKDQDIDINAPLGEPQVTPLHLASHLGRADILQALLTFPNADLNVEDKDGDTPLMLAIYGADSDAKAVVMSGVLMADKRCDIAKKNHNGVFPLCVAMKRNYRETTNLLLTKPRIKSYSPEDLVLAIKIAMMLELDGMADYIIERLDKSTWLAIAAHLSGDPRMEVLKLLIQDQMNTSDSSNNLEEDETVNDAVGHVLHKGNVVRVLGVETLKKENPKDKIEFLTRIANMRGIVQEISGTRVIIKVMGDKVLGKISAMSVVYMDDGPKQQIADGSDIKIGHFVKVFADVETVKELAKGHGGWNEEMSKACGRTGKVLEIDKDSDTLVGFAWGRAFYFNPRALLPGMAEHVETLDAEENFVGKGSAARVLESITEFVTLQETNRLSADDRHRALVGKMVTVQRAIITPFSKDRDVIVISNKNAYGVNARCLTLITKAVGEDGREFGIGCQVKLTATVEKLKSLQTAEFGNWSDSMSKVVGEIGRVTKIDINGKFEPSDMVVQVKFEKATFFMHPKALTLEKKAPTSKAEEPAAVTPPAEKREENVESKSNPPNPLRTPDSNELQLIERKDLICKKKLGEGAFGCVTNGYWRGTECAVKQIKMIVTSTISKEEIMKEAKIHYSLKHPNIVQLYGISFSQDLWMVMQLVKGPNLYKVIFPDGDKTIKALSFDDKTRISLQIANGISYIHERGFLHGDIKPHNMILDGSSNIFICDFGISRYLGSVDISTYATKYTATFGGTLYYISPECLRRDSSGSRYMRPTFKADIWSIGAVLYELFTAKQLFKDERALAKFKLFDDAEDLKKDVRSISSPAIRKIIEGALELLPEGRPTANEMNDSFLDVIKLSI